MPREALDAKPIPRLGVRTWGHQLELDHDLAEGATPDTSPEHALRATQLLSARGRRELADELDRAIAKAERPPPLRSPSIPVQADAVLQARDLLTALRRAVLYAPAPTVRGMALTASFVHDPHGPL